MRILTITAIAAAGLALAVPFVAYADPSEGGWGRMGMHHGEGRGGHGMGMGGMGAGGPMKMLQEFDTNDDGRLTQDEITAGQASKFAEANSDGQGGVTLAEFEPFFWQQRRDMMVRAFQFMDQDGSGEITEEEVSTLTANMVQRMDRNGDGALSPEDRRGRGEGRRGWWGGHDHDGPGNGRGPGMGNGPMMDGQPAPGGNN